MRTAALACAVLIGCAHSEAQQQAPAGSSEPIASASISRAPEPKKIPTADVVRKGRGFDAELTNYPYPFPVQNLVVRAQLQELQLAYMDVLPEKANGKAALLLHGKNFSGAYWERTIRALTEAGYRVIVPDQIGFGKSSKPRNFQYSFHALATHTAALLDALSVREVHVVGHSMGGMLATRFALMFPDRVSKLVLVNPIGLEDWKRWVPYRTIEEHYRAELQNKREKIRAYMKQAYFAGEWKPEYDRLTEILGGWAEGPHRELIAWTAALTSDMVFTQPIVHEFQDVKVPTLLIIGERDRTAIGSAWAPPEVKAKLGDYSVLGERAAAAIPGAKLKELPGVGHLPQVEAWDAYREALIGFLNAP